MSYRTDIKDAIQAQLAAADALSDATIITVLDRQLTPADMPAIIIYTLASRRGAESFGETTIPREVVVAIEAAVSSTPSSAETDAEVLAEAIENALDADKTLGNVVKTCEWQETVTDVNSVGDVTLGVVLLQYLVSMHTNQKPDGTFEFSDDGFAQPPTEVYAYSDPVADEYEVELGDDIAAILAAPEMETESACEDGSCAIDAWMGDAPFDDV